MREKEREREIEREREYGMRTKLDLASPKKP
jgi:hypothetical protein